MKKFYSLLLVAILFFSCDKLNNSDEIVGSLNDGDVIFFDSTSGVAPLCFDVFVGRSSSTCQWIPSNEYEEGRIYRDTYSSATFKYYLIDDHNAVLESTNYQQSSAGLRCWIGYIQMKFETHNTGTFITDEEALPYKFSNGAKNHFEGNFTIKSTKK